MKEQSILDRIARHPKSGWFTRPNMLEFGRYYLAYARDAQWAVLRFKSPERLAEWRSREWKIFRTPPTISDVTVPALELIEALISFPPEEMQCAEVWALVDAEPVRLVASTRTTPPPRGGVPLYGHGRHDLPIDQFANTHEHAGIHWKPFTIRTDVNFAKPFPAYRAFTWRGAPPLPFLPTAGGSVDGVSGERGLDARFSKPGLPVLIEAGGVFEENAVLECDAEGRAIQQSRGLGILRALESGTKGSVAWAVFFGARPSGLA